MYEEELKDLITEQTHLQAIQNEEIISLEQSIDIRDQISLLEFGKEASKGLSTFPNKILDTMKLADFERSDDLLKALGKIMDSFNKNDFTEKSGAFSKLFKNNEIKTQQLFDKYQAMGREIDKVFIEIKKYEASLKQSTQMLEDLYVQNVHYYYELQKYISAGQLRIKQLNSSIPALEAKVKSGYQIANFELTTLQNAIELLEQRVYDLKIASQLALQTAPQIRILQRGNTKLLGTINTAFIITIPVFKSGLISAIAMKRQSIVSKSMDELAKRTNEFIIKNAQTIAEHGINIADTDNQSFVDADTLQQSLDVILKGMQDTKNIEQQNKKLRSESEQKILQIQGNLK